MKKNIALILLKICIVCPIFLLFFSFSVLCEENPPTDNYPPEIVSVFEPQSIICTRSAPLYAYVTDEGTISRVWAEIITPPISQFNSENPITQMCYIDLESKGNSLYQRTYNEFNMEGTYRIVFYAKDAEGNISAPKPETETTVAVSLKSKAIIVAGGGYEGDILWEETGATPRCANLAHLSLTLHGYSSDTVYYLSSVAESDADGKNIVDADATKANLEYAIKTWAKDACEIFLYMVDHGGNKTFRMKNEVLDAGDLDLWLDEVQKTVPGKVIVLYDACKSGSFIPSLTPPEGKERIVATSTGTNESAVFANKGYDSFSYRFFVNLLIGDSFDDAFDSAKRSIQLIYNQTPLIDANGNGEGSDDEDIALAENIKLGNQSPIGCDMPTIETCNPNPQTLEGDICLLLYAENVTDADGVGKVWAVISPPNYTSISSDTPVTELPSLSLYKSGDNNHYETTYCGFTDQGDYRIIIYADDKQGTLGLPKEIKVTQTMPRGDVSGDGTLGLEDAIKGLKILLESDDSKTVPPIADVNGDGKIGLEEVIYVLQKLTEK